ncbi:hypothetical protein ACFLYO_00410 [Chloroflexota bacterium]
MLQPYINAVNIAKAKTEELLTPLTSAEDALEKRLDRTVQAFFQGEVDASAVQVLDRQLDAVRQRKSMMEDVRDEAEYQLAMARSTQAVERSLLEIQMARTKQEKQITSAVTKRSGSSSSRLGQAAKPKTTAADPVVDAPAGGALPQLSGFEVGDYLLGAEASELWGEMQTSFMEGLHSTAYDEQLGEFNQWSGRLSEQVGRIQSSTPFQGIADTFGTVFGSGEGSLVGQFNTFKTDFSTLWNDLFDPESELNQTLSTFFTGVGEEFNGLFNPTRETFLNVGSFVSGILGQFDETFGEGATAGIRTTLSGFSTWLGETWNTLFGAESLFASFSLDGILGVFTNVFGSGFNMLGGAVGGAMAMAAGGIEDQGGIRGVLEGFRSYVTGLFDPFGTLAGIFGSFSLQNILDTFIGHLGDGGFVRTVVNEFLAFAGSIFGEEGALQGVLDSVKTVVLAAIFTPVQAVINGVINVVVEGLNYILAFANQILDEARELPVLSGLLGNFQAFPKLNAADYHVDIVPELRTGGLFGPGMAKVHRGEVLVGAKSPTMVFPAQWVKAMERLAYAAEQLAFAPQVNIPSPVIIDGRASGAQVNNNFYGQADGPSVRRETYELAAQGVYG